jgi:hypothetical protein
MSGKQRQLRKKRALSDDELEQGEKEEAQQ